MAQVNLGRIGFVNKGSWSDIADYKLNDVVKYGGSTYAAKRQNTGVTPPIDGTDTDDWFYFVNNNDYIDKTSNQDIVGVKTFTSSPIVPVPTTNTQATNKQYVDSKTLNINTLPVKTTPVNTDNLALQEVGGGFKKLSFANLMAWIKSFSFGWGQVWVDVTASRSMGVTYTNTTGKPIQLIITINNNTLNNLYIDGVIITENNSTMFRTFYFAIIPNNSTYKVEGGTKQRWLELR